MATQAKRDATREALREVRGIVSTVVGAPLADGTHRGWIRTVVAAESPGVSL